MDRTHFANESTLRHIATLENRVQLLAKALREVRTDLCTVALGGELMPIEASAINTIDAALREAGLDISEKKAD